MLLCTTNNTSKYDDCWLLTSCRGGATVATAVLVVAMSSGLNVRSPIKLWRTIFTSYTQSLEVIAYLRTGKANKMLLFFLTLLSGNVKSTVTKMSVSNKIFFFSEDKDVILFAVIVKR